MSNLIVKIAYSGHVRRVTLSNIHDFTSIRSMIASTFSIPQSFTLTYVDDEDDMCTIITQQEWDEAVRMYGNNEKTLKLYINDTNHSVDMVTDSTTTTTAAVNEVCDNLAATCFIIDEAQAPTSSSSTESPAQETNSTISSHFLIPVDHLLQLLADPTFITLIPQLVKTGITHFIETRSCVAAVDAMTTILATSTFVNHPSIVALTQHIREIATKRDEKMDQFKQHRRWAHQHAHGHAHSHKGRWAERRVRIDAILTDVCQKTDRIPEFIPLVIATLTTLRVQVVASGDLTPVSTAITHALAHPTIASILSTMGADATRVQRRIMKRVFGQGCGKVKGHGCARGSWKKKHCHGSWKKKYGFGHCHAHRSRHQDSVACSEMKPDETTPSTDESVHRDVTCDMCGISPIAGIHYKCLDCPNYDLCSTCEMKTGDDAHPVEHRLLKIKKPRYLGHRHGHQHQHQHQHQHRPAAGHRQGHHHHHHHAHGPENWWMMRHALRSHGCGRKMHMMEHHGHGHRDGNHHHHHHGHRHGHGFCGLMHVLRHTSLAEPAVNVSVNVAKSV